MDVSALFQLNIDLVNRVPTTEVRMIRRVVRDDRFRGISPEQTLGQWPSVRRGEYAHVFRFQEECDAMFNSSLLDEMNALRRFVEASFAGMAAGSAQRDAGDRLVNLLGFFDPIDVDVVPFNSILREFIGGSIYTPDAPPPAKPETWALRRACSGVGPRGELPPGRRARRHPRQASARGAMLAPSAAPPAHAERQRQWCLRMVRSGAGPVQGGPAGCRGRCWPRHC